MQSLADFQAKFRVADLAVHRTGGWIVSVRPSQCTLGACVIGLDRECRSLGDATPDEAAGLIRAARWFEDRARAAFGADRFNHLALMMVDDQLHFHALPRYAAPRDLAGHAFADPGWPKVPDLFHANPSDDAVLAAVAATLKG